MILQSLLNLRSGHGGSVLLGEVGGVPLIAALAAEQLPTLAAQLRLGLPVELHTQNGLTLTRTEAVLGQPPAPLLACRAEQHLFGDPGEVLMETPANSFEQTLLEHAWRQDAWTGEMQVLAGRDAVGLQFAALRLLLHVKFPAPTPTPSALQVLATVEGDFSSAHRSGVLHLSVQDLQDLRARLVHRLHRSTPDGWTR